jgi:hypothetical protein
MARPFIQKRTVIPLTSRIQVVINVDSGHGATRKRQHFRTETPSTPHIQYSGAASQIRYRYRLADRPSVFGH